MIIDSHTHVANYGTADELIRGIKENELEKAVILPIAVSKDTKEAEKLNNFVSTTVLRDPRLEGFASVNPGSKDAVEEAQRAICELGLKGFKFDSNRQRFRFEDDGFWSLLECIKPLKVPVAVHSGYSPDSPDTEPLFFDPEEINEVVISFPDIEFIFTHLGRYENREEFPKVYPEKNVYFETSDAPPEVIQEVIGACGADKVIFGSDFKCDSYPVHEIEKIRALPVSDIEKEKILYKNIAKVLGIHVEKDGSRFQNLRKKILRYC